MIRTKWLNGKDDLCDAWAVRREVFIEEQGVSEELEMDDMDTQATHIVVYEDETPIACGRLLETEEGFLAGRIAVLKSRRGQRYGDLVVRLLIRRAYEHGAEKLFIHSQLSAKGFYEKLGFAEYGEVYMEAGIPHIHMQRYGDITGNCE